MSAQSLENYSSKGTGRPARRSTIAREEYAFLAAAKRGDSAAFEILCKQSANTVFHIARRMMRNNEDAEDVAQESFQQAFTHLESFNGDSRFSTWLSRIAINAALMKLRKKHGLRDVSLDELAESGARTRNRVHFLPYGSDLCAGAPPSRTRVERVIITRAAAPAAYERAQTRAHPL